MTTEMPVAVSRLSERVQAVPPSGIRKFFDVIATMPDVISLGVGEPDFATPPQVVEEGVRSLRSGRTHYTSNYGTLELRRALASAPRAPVRRRLQPGQRDLRHRRRLRGGGGGDVGDHRSRRRGPPPRAVVRRLRAGDHVQRWHAGARFDPPPRSASRSYRSSSRRPSRRGPRSSSWATRATQPVPCSTRRRCAPSPISPSATT